MFHVKCLVVDGLLVSAGSTNFDNRSFAINDEANLNVLDPAFARRQLAVFEGDWARARPITYARWAERPAMEKLRDHIANLLGPQL
jgi:cardiolipin synthase